VLPETLSFELCLGLAARPEETATIKNKGNYMGYYLFEGSYTPEALKALIKKPVNRSEVIRKAVAELGGSVEGSWFAFGERDVVLIVQMPDNVSVAALSLAVGAGGAIQHGKTTPLMTMEEGLAAFKKAATSTYRPPGK
jgi:uncharacterized protein with GYD domain